MNELSTEKRVQVLRYSVKGNSIRSTVRITGVAKNTISKLLKDVGKVCSEFQDKAFHDLPCKKLQCDEIWSFCYSKQRNVPEHLKDEFGYGDVWVWTAIDADTKLVPSWMVSDRTVDTATAFFRDLASRLNNRVQLTTDGHRPYLEAIENTFGSDIDYSKLIKVSGFNPEGQKRYSLVKIKERVVTGNPDKKGIATSYVERQNLTMRMSMRRFTRLTDAFSKKVENHIHTISLHFMYYNFCRIHKTLKVTPAMEAKVTNRLWNIEDIVDLLD